MTDVLADYAEEVGPTTSAPWRIGCAIDALAPVWQSRTVGQVTKETCKRYVTVRARSNGTARRELGVLRAAINHAHREGRLTRTVAVYLPASAEPCDRWLTRGEAAALLLASLRAADGELFLSIEDREQVLRFNWLPFLKGRYVRPRFLCPGCGRGAYLLHDKAGTFACRACCRYDYKIRHRQLFSLTSPYRRIAMLRKQLGADPDPLSAVLPKREWRRIDYRRLVAELARAEEAAYADVERLLADLDKRAKMKAEP